MHQSDVEVAPRWADQRADTSPARGARQGADPERYLGAVEGFQISPDDFGILGLRQISPVKFKSSPAKSGISPASFGIWDFSRSFYGISAAFGFQLITNDFLEFKPK